MNLKKMTALILAVFMLTMLFAACSPAKAKYPAMNEAVKILEDKGLSMEGEIDKDEDGEAVTFHDDDIFVIYSISKSGEKAKEFGKHMMEAVGSDLKKTVNESQYERYEIAIEGELYVTAVRMDKVFVLIASPDKITADALLKALNIQK